MAYPRIFLLKLLSFLFLPAGCSGQMAEVQGVTAFTNVNVVPMDSPRVLEEQTVIIKDGVIFEIGSSETVHVPEEAKIINGQGNYLLPGLTDFHIHLRSTDELVSYLAYGVTTVVHMSGAMNGAPELLYYKKQLNNHEMIGPRLLTTGPILDGNPPIFAGVSTSVSAPEEARRVVAEQKKQGYDFIKVYNNLSPDLLNAITGEAEVQGMSVIGHIPRMSGREQALQQALDAGMAMIAHGEEYFFTYFYSSVDSLLDRGQIPNPDENEIPVAVQITREAGTAVTPNLSFAAMTRKQLDSLDTIFSDFETRYLHPEVLEMWKEQNSTQRPDLERFDKREKAKYVFLKKLMKALNDAGVPLLLGTDASAPGLFPGQSAHVELCELVEAGLTPYEALAAGTRNAGKFINSHVSASEPFGVIEAGQQADLILAEGNPLENIYNASNIRGVMKGGRWFPIEQLAEMRNHLAEKYQGM